MRGIRHCCSRLALARPRSVLAHERGTVPSAVWTFLPADGGVVDLSLGTIIIPVSRLLGCIGNRRVGRISKSECEVVI